VLERYLYIVVFLLVRGFLVYFIFVYVLYIVAFGIYNFFSKRGVPASASIDAYGFLLKLLKYPHYYSSWIREDR
jgi:hypothetical protein